MLKPLLLAAACAAVLTECATSSMTEPTPAMTAAYAAAVADTRRPSEEVARDPLRHPAEMLAFAQVQAGDRIADIRPGGLLHPPVADVAGAEGRVYAFVPNRTAADQFVYRFRKPG